ncbi:MAG: DUF5658 family protein [Planctomycetota bacterium]|nr:hypothetical protein [Planctomycetaceae bacterium]MDQ3330408.1 DUF5658 family protein [Planctomycetota bacterium]
MSKTRDERLSDETRAKGWFRGHLPLETETTFFILVNVLDIVLTVALVSLTREQDDRYHEGNPVARFFLDHWGVRGLVYYKMAMVGFVCAIAQLIARRNLAVARRLMYGLTAIVAVVVAYSAFLLSRAL